jgi:hypothetical protein
MTMHSARANSKLESWDYGCVWDRIVAIGDLHGDLDALLRILIGLDVVNGDGGWMAPATFVAILGDLNDRGPDSASVVSFVMKLQQDAKTNRGKVESLLGNHELMAAQGDYCYTRAVEVLALEEFRFDQRMGLHAFYRGESPYAVWIRNRPTIIKAADCLFVHAGVGDWSREYDPEWVNSTVASWVASFQGVADEPDEGTFWLVEESGKGPLWTTGLKLGAAATQRSALPVQTVAAVLDFWGARHLVVGHTPTRTIDYAISYPHPTYGDAVAIIDTGISRWFGGRLSALEIRNGSLTPRYFERGLEELPLTKRIRKLCQEERVEISINNRRTSSTTL